MKRPPLLPLLGGVAVGFLNGLLGAGGGMLTVPLLEHNGLPPQKSQTLTAQNSTRHSKNSEHQYSNYSTK